MYARFTSHPTCSARASDNTAMCNIGTNTNIANTPNIYFVAVYLLNKRMYVTVSRFLQIHDSYDAATLKYLKVKEIKNVSHVMSFVLIKQLPTEIKVMKLIFIL